MFSFNIVPENSSLFVSENDSTSNDECETETELEFKGKISSF